MPVGLTSEDKLCHEDLKVGKAFACGHTVVTEPEIVAFARSYDSHSFAGDAPTAKSLLVASPIHTCAIMMRLVCDGVLNRMASLGSPGVDTVCWLKPVRPGQLVHVSYTPLAKRVLASRPDVGLSKVLVELRDDTGAAMATWRTNQLTRMRHPGPAAPSSVTASRSRGIDSLWDTTTLVQNPAATGGYLEDHQIGETADVGDYTFTKTEMMTFARQFDPQPFHLNEAAAKASLFGNLSASGWQSAAYLMRLIARAHQHREALARAAGIPIAANGALLGCKNLLWPKPVLVGDTVAYRTRITGKVDLPSSPNHGLLVGEAQGRNQRGEIVITLTTQKLVERRRGDGA